MDLRWILIGGLLAVGAYNAFIKKQATPDDAETADKRKQLINWGIPQASSFTAKEVQAVWLFKYYEGMGNFNAADQLWNSTVKAIRDKYNAVFGITK